MLQHTLTQLFQRDIERVKNELLAYPDESVLWQVDKQVNNSAGNLALHLAGNLQHFMGALLNDSGYVRNRPAEFSDKNVAREKVLAELDRANEAVRSTLENLTAERLEKMYPIEVFGAPLTNENFVVHLYGHLNYHLGQISYHRRLLS